MASTATSPSFQKPNSVTVKGFKISTQKLPILKADPIEEMTKELGITPPEMIFGDNFVAIEHEQSSWGIAFNAFDALDRVDKTGTSMLKVAYSREWQKSRYSTIFAYLTGHLHMFVTDWLLGRRLTKESKKLLNPSIGLTLRTTWAQ